MNIRCRTNIDKWNHTAWPTEFVIIPLVGDYVEGIGPGDFRPRLKVHSITHSVEYHRTTHSSISSSAQHIVTIELG